MPAIIATGFLMLYFLVAGLSDRHQGPKRDRPIDPMSVPYETSK